MKILPIILILFSSLAYAQDDILVSYTFDQASSLNEMLSPSKVQSKVSATAITGNHVTQVPQHAFSSAPENRMAVRATKKTVAPSIKDALVNATYFSFTIAPDAGQELILRKLTFTAQGGGKSAYRAFYVFCETTGFASEDVFLSAVQAGNKNDTLNSESPTPYTIQFPDIRVSAPTEFRIYIDSDSDRKTVIFDNITVYGKISKAP